MSPDEALRILMEGNERFRTGRSAGHQYSSSRIAELSQAQTPIAAIVACSDSRVSPEIVFDQPLGSIFACRVPGNVATESSKWVVDMAVTEFRVPVVMVMGHSGCLAIGQVQRGGGYGMSGMLRMEIKAGISSVRSTDRIDDPGKVIAANAQYAADQLVMSTQSLRNAVEEGRTKCLAAVYEMESGQVRFLE